MAEIPTPTTGYSAPSGERPLGVTIIAILNILGGLLSLVGALLVFAAASLLGPFGFIFLAVAAVIAILGLLSLVVGWGLWALKSWAWMLALIINLINLILNLFSGGSGYVSAIINLIVVIYLFQGDVKSRFR